ncbi:MAG: Ca-activated chloride channel [Pseudonocardiales bacterium]|nr:Ca-activated chloride channel [Pseudonocardiales bacterium]MDX6307084.1 Ca-activated chloride channel [Nocardioidaceae bacterium]
MTFLEPVRLWLLLVVPVLVAVYVLLQRNRSRRAVLFTNLALLDTVAPRRMNWRQHVAVLLALLTLAGALVLFAQPSGVVRVPRRTAVTVVLTMDVSLSMQATDVPPNRITAAKVTARKFLDALPGDYKVGLVSFAQYAKIVVAPTTNRTAVTRAINSLTLHEYTATGEGIFTALGVVKQALAGTQGSPGNKLPAMIVMISDGKRTVGRSQVLAAQAAKAQGVPVYTVALGTPNATVTSHGQVIPVPVEIGQLRQISAISGGKAYVASSPADLLKAYRDVGGRLVYEKERTDVTSRYLGWLVLMALLSTAAGLFVAARWP